MARAGSLFIWGVLFVVPSAGCKTYQPDLKPPPAPEVLTVPPKEARFNQSQYPDMAFRDLNSKFARPLDGGGIMPARASTTAPGMSGMGSGGLGSGGMGGVR